MSDEAIQFDPVGFESKCKSYLQNYIPDLSKCFVAGGFFPRLYHNLPIRDIDVYVGSDDDFIGFVQDYQKIPNIETIKTKRKFYRFRNQTTGIEIDLIGFHKPRDITFLKIFDFTICQGYFEGNQFQTYSTETLKDIVQKRLRFTGFNAYVEGSSNNILTRMKKYRDLGFEITTEDLNAIYQYLTGPDVKKYSLAKYTDK
jgi:hypothetical protein